MLRVLGTKGFRPIRFDGQDNCIGIGDDLIPETRPSKVLIPLYKSPLPFTKSASEPLRTFAPSRSLNFSLNDG
jgi:hypothetical protein